MDQEERQFAMNVLRQMFIGSQLDGIKFGLSPATTYVFFMHYNDHEPDQVWLNIESKWSVYPRNTTLFPNSEEDIEDMTEDEQFKLLYELRREEVIDICIGNDSPHLYIAFKSGKILFNNGFHEQYECWQAGDG
ncbi:hypothetical protein RAH41_19750 [Gottfriedia acidiceleris]|uniref:hypothetical protein n=1 Tax=Gottfriedia acidiceleris TaxID=371036 RepID=UPI002F265F5B